MSTDKPEWELVSFAPVAPGWVVKYDDGRKEPLAGYMMARVEGALKCFPASADVVVGHDWGWLVGEVRRPQIARIYPADPRATTRIIDVVFTEPPGGPDDAPAVFVEVEDDQRRSIQYGEWIERDDGYWVLRIRR